MTILRHYIRNRDCGDELIDLDFNRLDDYYNSLFNKVKIHNVDIGNVVAHESSFSERREEDILINSYACNKEKMPWVVDGLSIGLVTYNNKIHIGKHQFNEENELKFGKKYKISTWIRMDRLNEEEKLNTCMIIDGKEINIDKFYNKYMMCDMIMNDNKNEMSFVDKDTNIISIKIYSKYMVILNVLIN